MAPPHVSGVDLHLQMKDIKTIEELPKKTILGKRKKRDGEEEDGQGMWNKKSILWELEYWELLDVRHSIDTCTPRRMCARACVEHCCNRGAKEKIMRMQGMICKIWALGRSSMQRKQTRGQSFL